MKYSPKVKVAILAKTGSFCSYLEALVLGRQNCERAGVYRTAAAAIRGITSQKPDVLLFDLNTATTSEKAGLHSTALEFINRVHREFSELKIILIVDGIHKQTILALLEAGAIGCVTQPVDPVQLLNSIQEAHNGGSPMDASITRLLVKALHDRGNRRLDFTKLTAREQRILELMSEGLDRSQIGKSLGISPLTVGTHFKNIFEKLGVHSQVQAVANYLGKEPK